VHPQDALRATQAAHIPPKLSPQVSKWGKKATGSGSSKCQLSAGFALVCLCEELSVGLRLGGCLLVWLETVSGWRMSAAGDECGRACLPLGADAKVRSLGGREMRVAVGQELRVGSCKLRTLSFEGGKFIAGRALLGGWPIKSAPNQKKKHASSSSSSRLIVTLFIVCPAGFWALFELSKSLPLWLGEKKGPKKRVHFAVGRVEGCLLEEEKGCPKAQWAHFSSGSCAEYSNWAPWTVCGE